MKFHFLIILGIIFLTSCSTDPDEQGAKNETEIKTESTINKKPSSNEIPESIESPAAPITITEPPIESNEENISKPLSKSATNSASALSPSANIEIATFNEAYLISLVRDGINKIRKQKGAVTLKRNEILNNAARDHNAYLIRNKELTHEQNNRRKHKVMDRVKTYGGGFSMVGENVQYQGLAQLTTGNRTEIIPESYEEMAKKLIKNWVDSPGHYDNLIESEFREDGMAIGWNPNNYAFYATHVFGVKR